MRSGITCTCVDCGHTFAPDDPQYLCPRCGDRAAPLRGLLYLNYPALAAGTTLDGLSCADWLPLLPLCSAGSLPPLRVGRTPLYQRTVDGREVWLKDDSQNPTWSYKDRASAVVSAYAHEHGLKTIVVASTGNAGSSLAGICAAQGQRAVVIVPAAAPEAKLMQALCYGATVVRVDGNYDDAFELSLRASEAYGWYNRNTAFNPLTIEGKKTAAFEIACQMGAPDRVFVPVGDGVIAAGVWKGFIELHKAGLIDKIPCMALVQATGSANLVRNLASQNGEFPPAHTLADSICVTVPRNLGMMRYLAARYPFETITVSDGAIMDAALHLAQTQGLFVEPAAGAAWAGWLAGGGSSSGRDVVLLTGSGLKDIAPLRRRMTMPAPIRPDLDALSCALGNPDGDI
ncbi:MAG: pyridoxal-phosphate dependent enzyme [Candidatus Cloacimonetes bacterium]|nr:pyridoxal-phosphate dependent enzyme [Candidatus Cloacimonadota bacterium]